ncbi:DnaJ C-terminal domain-containing protein [Nocardioides flavescens]|uniref:Chaperone protein DnaJ n=1 Tax=Nocardioides flavescens TaxID=2691959 RepID=A0A6L7EVJ7_9ACTN|nr:DnaJ C-terminal domain-containing protein [Nocardioides flavescens]MXG89726.1 DnaJ domain-containing protein [Nocardioides flavescens]
MAANDGFRPEWAQKDFYAVLGVKKDAAIADIKKAYRKLARENHPDSNPGDTAKHERFKAVAEAYDVLGDTEKRKKYDEMRSLYGSGGFRGGFGGSGGGGGFGGGGFNLDDLLRDRGGAGGAGAGGPGVGDLFGDLFGGFGRGGRSSQPRPQKGADAETTATISFDDALEGVTISLRLTSDAPCPDCNGTGGKPGTKPRICPECEGAGYVASTAGGGFSLNETCPRCGGRQLIYDEPCPTCKGSGHGMSARTIQARIPAGVKDGQRIRLKGKGSSGSSGGPAGDLFVTVKVTPHRLFGRKDDNLTLEVPISFDEAALGADVRIPTRGGNPVTVKVPPGTPSGRTFRVRGKGARRKDGTYGDLLATVLVHVPGTLDPAAREAVEAYRAATADRPLRANLFEEARS